MCGDTSGKKTRGWVGQRDHPERDYLVPFRTPCHAHVSQTALTTHVVQQTSAFAPTHSSALTETISVSQTIEYIAVLRLNFKYLWIRIFLLQLTTALSHWSCNLNPSYVTLPFWLRSTYSSPNSPRFTLPQVEMKSPRLFMLSFTSIPAFGKSVLGSQFKKQQTSFVDTLLFSTAIQT